MQYYPFGLPYEAHYQPEEQPYKYGGKEFIELHGYDSYDFDARSYYPGSLPIYDDGSYSARNITPSRLMPIVINNPVKYIDQMGGIFGRLMM